MPIMLESDFTSDVFIVYQMLATRYPSNLFVRLLGVWEPMEDSQQLVATSGVVYYMSPPHTMKEAIVDPIHTVIYIIFMLSACALFSKTWIEVSGSRPRYIAMQLEVQQTVRAVVYPRLILIRKRAEHGPATHREGSMYKDFKRVVPLVATLGDAILGLLSVVADLMGAIGSGTGILMAVTTIYSYWEIGMRESGGPEMAAFGDLL
ncbi:Protein transport protein Sec61 alpha [Mycena chlorophos]|uniref:Protein transport protein Sec61 alpha n=1 Tax=Mycena chlorophos TaxID=658473 RepID=A0A8H6SZJ0_MYCCL|nr:Protein transport protein Sec61 alpha [Mycena chlorophos]